MTTNLRNSGGQDSVNTCPKIKDLSKTTKINRLSISLAEQQSKISIQMIQTESIYKSSQRIKSKIDKQLLVRKITSKPSLKPAVRCLGSFQNSKSTENLQSLVKLPHQA